VFIWVFGFGNGLFCIRYSVSFLVFGLWGAPVALLVFGFGSGLFLASLLSDLLLWFRELKELIRFAS